MATLKNQCEPGTFRQTDIAKARLVKLAPLTADPADAENGDMWYRSDTDQIRAKLNDLVVILDVTPA